MSYEIDAYRSENLVSTSSYCGGVSRYSLIYALLAKFTYYVDCPDYHFVVRPYNSQRISKKVSNIMAKEMLEHFKNNGGFDLGIYGNSPLRHYKCSEINQIFKGVFALS